MGRVSSQVLTLAHQAFRRMLIEMPNKGEIPMDSRDFAS